VGFLLSIKHKIKQSLKYPLKYALHNLFIKVSFNYQVKKTPALREQPEA
jgi:hypothetical protein